MESEADHMEIITYNIAYRFRIYPNREQEILLAKTFGCCRFLYNQMLKIIVQSAYQPSIDVSCRQDYF